MLLHTKDYGQLVQEKIFFPYMGMGGILVMELGPLDHTFIPLP